MRDELVGRIGKRGGRGYEGYDNQSRDAALIIPCQNVACPVNASLYCSMPSKISMNTAGVCMTGLEFKEKPAVQPSRFVCKWCAGSIRPIGTRGQHGWEHVGEKLSHLAEPR